jgi:hypothetical protein
MILVGCGTNVAKAENLSVRGLQYVSDANNRAIAPTSKCDRSIVVFVKF